MHNGPFVKQKKSLEAGGRSSNLKALEPILKETTFPVG
jgi:hypothetical protein